VEWLALGGTLAFIGAVLATPLAALVVRSLRVAGAWSFDAYRALAETGRGSVAFVPPLEALGNSLAMAVVAASVALVVGGSAAHVIARRQPDRRRGARRTVAFDALLMLPLGTSAVTIGFGFVLALDRPPVDLRDSWLLIPLAQALVAMPFVVRVLVPAWRGIDERHREAARVLGAGPWRVWREIDLPLLGRAGVVALGFAMAISLGEFGATVFLARPDLPTLPVLIERLLGRPGASNTGQAMAASTLLMLLTVVLVSAGERLRPRQSGAI